MLNAINGRKISVLSPQCERAHPPGRMAQSVELTILLLVSNLLSNEVHILLNMRLLS